MRNQADVVCLGAAIVDIPLQPVSKEIFDHVSFPVERIAPTLGGDALNESIILSRLGANVTLLSSVGKDYMGSYILEECKKNGVDISSVTAYEDIDTSINIGLVTEDGERTFVSNRNGSLWRLTIDDLDLDRLQGAKVLSLASIFNHPLLDNNALVRIFSKAKAEGLTICADIKNPRNGESLEDIREALSYIDYFFPNQDEACELTGKEDLNDVADALLDYGIANIIIKTGKDGCFIKNFRETIQVPAYQKAKRLDTTGAGDNFAAGFITALLDGLSIRECGEFANGVASVSVEAVGATTAVQNREQVYNMMGISAASTRE
jgi:sugar/nucleoside kinase (ribokinase family)